MQFNSLIVFYWHDLGSIITKLTFVALAWFQSGIFEVLWSDIVYAAQLGGLGGHIRFLLGFVISF